MLLIIVFCLFAAASFAYFLLNQTDKMEQQPDLQKVRKAVERFGKKFQIKSEDSEEDIEKQLSKYLQIHFRQVRRQFPVGEFSQRERIDIDIAGGSFGIEIKLASLLKKTNERNRLFGQIDTYQTRRYGRHRLLVVIAGETDWANSPLGVEMKQILTNKGAGLIFLPVK